MNLADRRKKLPANMADAPHWADEIYFQLQQQRIVGYRDDQSQQVRGWSAYQPCVIG